MNYPDLLKTLIEQTVAQGASDLHLGAGAHPIVRVSGTLTSVFADQVLTDEDIRELLSQMVPPERLQKFLETRELDFSFSYSPKVRFRGNAFVERGHVGVALRLIPNIVRTLQELNLPPEIEQFATREHGFFLVVGPVGQGKTTTIATLVEKINLERTEHIVTIEDPIEYLFENKRSIIDQREVRVDTANFESALESVFRQDVDVLMIGEMRTPETMATAVTAAETGHLVFSTLHTNNASQTIDRIIDSFPAGQQEQIRMQLAGSLAGIFSQRLLPRLSGGLLPAYELLINNKAIANLIREKRTHEIDAVIETSSQEGMIDMNRCLADMVRAGEITPETAYTQSWNPKSLERLLL